jgi:hypothetical protein
MAFDELGDPFAIAGFSSEKAKTSKSSNVKSDERPGVFDSLVERSV